MAHRAGFVSSFLIHNSGIIKFSVVLSILESEMKLKTSENIDPIISANVLLVEDSKDHQFLLVKRLNEIGIHNITISDTGETAVEKIKEVNEFDLILVD